MYRAYWGRDPQIFESHAPFPLESGAVLPHLRIVYHTYGTLRGGNVRWVCHALTASSDVADWWPGTVVEGGFLDPAKHFVVCANMLGSCYGTFGPMDMPTGEFPQLSFGDMARAHQLLASHLGIGRIECLVGGSTGGYQAMEWAFLEPDRFDRLSLLATLPRSTAWIRAASEAERMTLDAGGDSNQALAAARAIAMLQFRGAEAYNLTQDEPSADWSVGETKTDPAAMRVASYQRYQGEKLAKRFDVGSYRALLNALDGFDLGRGDRGGVAKALSTIKCPVAVIGFSTDIMYPIDQVRRLAEALPNGTFYQVDSPFGHDGFLVETTAINTIFK